MDLKEEVNYTEVGIDAFADKKVWKVDARRQETATVGVLMPLEIGVAASVSLYDTGIFRFRGVDEVGVTVLMLTSSEAAKLALFIIRLLVQAGATELLKNTFEGNDNEVCDIFGGDKIAS